MSAPALATTLPPPQFQSPTAAYVRFADKRNLSAACEAIGTPKPWWAWIEACSYRDAAGNPVLILPNPCQSPNDHSARVVCHEIGHANGWSGEHEKEPR